MKFGEYFKELRKEKGTTQEEIALAIGKSKMLVSGVETGRNHTFIDSDLKKISKALNLSPDEENKLFKEASKAKSQVPTYLYEYMNLHDEVYGLLDVIVEKNMSSKMIRKIKRYAEELEKC